MGMGTGDGGGASPALTSLGFSWPALAFTLVSCSTGEIQTPSHVSKGGEG